MTGKDNKQGASGAQAGIHGIEKKRSSRSHIEATRGDQAKKLSQKGLMQKKQRKGMKGGRERRTERG